MARRRARWRGVALDGEASRYSARKSPAARRSPLRSPIFTYVCVFRKKCAKNASVWCMRQGFAWFLFDPLCDAHLVEYAYTSGARRRKPSPRGRARTAVGSPAVGSPLSAVTAVGSPAVGSPAVGSPAVGSPAVGSHGRRQPRRPRCVSRTNFSGRGEPAAYDGRAGPRPSSLAPPPNSTRGARSPCAL
jgi:hypothetical protein